jgi:hypothetical protein
MELKWVGVRLQLTKLNRAKIGRVAVVEDTAAVAAAGVAAATAAVAAVVGIEAETEAGSAAAEIGGSS